MGVVAQICKSSRISRNSNLPRSDDGGPVETLREMFADDAKMQVTQDSNGIIRMVETDVPQHILNLKIEHLFFNPEYEKLDPVAFDSPGGALSLILGGLSHHNGRSPVVGVNVIFQQMPSI